MPSHCVRGVGITTTDSGIGLDPEDHERIFDKFSHSGQAGLHSSGTVRFRGGGPGLGLAIVKGIVMVHRGDVWVESAGCDVDACPGSCFHVLLPVEQPVVGEEMKRRLLQIEAIGFQKSQAGGPASSDN